MKTFSILSTALTGVVLSGSVVFAGDVIEKETTTTTTYSGTVADLSPSSSTIVIKSESSTKPMSYRFNKSTTWIDASGNVITSDQVRDNPVTVYYVKKGDSMVVTKVVATKPLTTKKTTTSTTTTVE